jgi:hypothetical protein
VADDSEQLYKVGYRKPPRESQFKPGQSGNRQGRPKGSENIATVLQDELNARVAVTANGRRSKISMRRAAIMQAVAKAAKGDQRALLLILNELRLNEAKAQDRAARDVSDHRDDAKLVDGILGRIRRNLEQAPAGGELGGEPSEPSAESGGDDDPKPI